MATTKNLKRYAAQLRNDTSGAILPYVTLMLVVLVGTSVLALDGTRYISLQSQLQKGADALAIAGAAELDRLPDAITRATNAVDYRMAAGLDLNRSLFGPAGSQIVVAASHRFLSSLPASDSSLITAANVTTDPTQARFIEVTVTPITMPTILPASFFGGANSRTGVAAAVAGMDQVMCGAAPIFICNPFEQPGDTYAQATQRLQTADTDPALQRKLIRFSDPTGGGASQTWGPGAFGYLVPETGTLTGDGCFPSAGNGIGEAMAASRTPICVRQNGVDLQPGNTTAAVNGLNTRFGLYGQSMPESCKSTYPPDVNVRKGYKAGSGQAGWCRADPDGKTSGSNLTWPPGEGAKSLPLDSCFASTTCSPGNVGNGVWDCLSYWTASHPGVAAPTGCTNAATISRHSIYQYEISNNRLADANPVTGETGAPQCSAGTAQPNRRILRVAIVNCGSSPVAIQSNAQNVPVAAFGKFFLTVPVPNEAQNKPYAELLGLVKKGEDGNFDQVQLYR